MPVYIPMQFQHVKDKTSLRFCTPRTPHVSLQRMAWPSERSYLSGPQDRAAEGAARWCVMETGRRWGEDEAKHKEGRHRARNRAASPSARPP